jgi:hypothetical protein
LAGTRPYNKQDSQKAFDSRAGGNVKNLGVSAAHCLKFERAHLPEIEMKVTIRVEITTDWNETENFEIGEIERRYCELDRSKIGLSLAEGKVEGRLGELSRGLRELPRYVSSIDEFPKTSTQRIRKN